MARGSQSRRAVLAGGGAGSAASLGRALAKSGSARRRRGTLPELLLIPQDLRTADPSFFAELSAGTMGLAGATVSIGSGSPFTIAPPTPEWQAALLGFGWLSDLRASNAGDALALARRTVDDWLLDERPAGAVDWLPAIAARRLMSWLSNAGMLIENATPEAYGRLMRGFGLHMARLAAIQADGDPCPLLARIAPVMGCLCLSDQDGLFGAALAGLQAELERQILPHGGHISRNPSVPVEVLLDLLPLRQCFMASAGKPPAWLTDTMQRMVPMLRHLQMGDRSLARFNGMSATEFDRLAAVLSYNVGELGPDDLSATSGYVRLSRRATQVVLDGGQLPPRQFSADAHAGALAFEMSSGDQLLIVNAGAPSPAAQAWRRQSRGTPAHSTLLLNDISSSRLIAKGADRAHGRPASEYLAGPAIVEAKFAATGDGAAEVRCWHNGYQQRHGMVHARVLRLSAHGERLSGIDRIFNPQRGAASAGKGDLNYSIHFHIHPQARVRFGAEPGLAEIELRNGETWKFSAFGCKLSLEDSLFFASFTGPTRNVQIVLRGHVLADTQIRWMIESRAAVPEPQLRDSTS